MMPAEFRDPRDFAAMVGAGAWFRALAPAFQGRLLDAAAVRQLEDGESLFAKGDRPDGVYCVVAGGLRMTTVSQAGRLAMLAIAEPPQWFGEIALFDGEPRSHDAWATGPTTVLHVRQQPLMALLDESPRHWHSLGLLLTHKLRSAFTAIEEVALLSAEQRLARRLVALADGWGQSPGRSKREIRVPQEQLGQMLALSRQTVNQLLQQLASSGAIRLVRGAIEIVDLDALRRLSAG